MPDRVIAKVLLWSAGNDYYSAFEIDAIESLVRAAGIEVIRRSGQGSTSADFIADYSDPSFDLVWVAGHGDIDHWHEPVPETSIHRGAS